MVWLLNARKQQDLFRLEDLTMGDFSSNMRARLLPELNLRDVAPFVADGERLMFPYRVMLAPSLTGTNVRLGAESGYVNILLPPIPEVKKDRSAQQMCRLLERVAAFLDDTVLDDRGADRVEARQQAHRRAPLVTDPH